MTGKVYLVGAGPGAADLLTLRAARVLSLADVVLYDRLVGADVRALISSQAEQISVGKIHGRQAEQQDRIFRLMFRAAMAGKTVVRLKGGDPSVFGRMAEEWLFLQDLGIPVEVVPGISSAIAAAELAGVPLTARGVAESFAVITGHSAVRQTDWQKYAHMDTLVILMGVSRRAEIARALIHAGRAPDTPVMFVTNATRADEKVTLSRLLDVSADLVNVESPSVFVIGEVVSIRDVLLAPERAVA